MENLIFRMYAPEDKEKIFNLWKSYFNPGYIEKRKDIFSWIVEKNPYFNGKAPYHIVLDGDELIAYYGKMPVRFMVKGKILYAFFCHDVYVHKKYRGKEKAVSDRLVKTLEEKSDSFVGAIWFNQPNYKLHKRCGWLDIKNCYPYIKLYNVNSFIDEMFKNKFIRILLTILGNILVRLIDLKKLLYIERKNFIIKPIQHFDKRFDHFAKEVSKNFGIIVLRNSEYLNWKYVERPHMKYSILEATERGALLGYIVFRFDKSNTHKKGIILDVLAFPQRPDVFHALVLKALDYFSMNKVDYVECLNTYPPFKKILKKNGFFRARRAQPFMIINWEKFFSENYVRNIENWYLTLGDSDGDVWTVE